MDLFKWANKQIVERGARRDESGPLYKPLTGKQVRLLYLQPDEISGDLRFNMMKASLDDDSFVALSYVWGNPADTVPIKVNGHTLQVTKNLAEALRHARFYLKYTLKFDEIGCYGVPFWCDAICIDQHNIEEKNHQVPMMQEIYTKAHSVFAWLGHDPATAAAMREIEEISAEVRKHFSEEDKSPTTWISKHQKLCQSDEEQVTRTKVSGNPVWDRLQDFTSNPYFKRAWIVQEVVLPRLLMFLCGTSSLRAYHLETVLYWTISIRLNKASRPEQVSPRIWTWLCSNSFWEKFDLIRERVWALREAHENPPSATNRVINLESLGVYAVNLECSNPKDRIFALRSLLAENIDVDYGRSTAEIYSNYFKLVLEKSGSLDLLVFAGTGVSFKSLDRLRLPSWCPDFHNLDAGQLLSWKRDTPGEDLSKFAEECQALKEKRNMKASIMGQMLRARGFEVAPVREVNKLQDSSTDIAGSAFFALRGQDRLHDQYSLCDMFTMVYQQMGTDAPNIHLSLLAFLAWMVSMYRISKQAKDTPGLTFGDALGQFLAEYGIPGNNTFAHSLEGRNLLFRMADLDPNWEGGGFPDTWTQPDGKILRPARELLDPEANWALYFNPVDARHVISSPFKSFGEDLTRERALMSVMEAIKRLSAHAAFQCEGGQRAGIGSKEIRKGDLVAMVHGFPHLLIIRRGLGQNENIHQIVGCCLLTELSPLRVLSNAKSGMYSEKDLDFH